MTLMTGGQLVARALKQEGVEVIFTLSGGHIMDIFNGCLDEGIRIVDVRHEQSAVPGRGSRNCANARRSASNRTSPSFIPIQYRFIPCGWPGRSRNSCRRIPFSLPTGEMS